MIEKTIIEKYIEASLLREKAIKDVKPKIANKYFHELKKYYDELRDSNRLNELFSLLTHENKNVQLNAAIDLLTISEEAKNVIKHIAETEKGELGMTAKMTLREWDNGNLKKYLLE